MTRSSKNKTTHTFHIDKGIMVPWNLLSGGVGKIPHCDMKVKSRFW